MRLHREIFDARRRLPDFASSLFCQDGAQMSGGILSLPRPGLRRDGRIAKPARANSPKSTARSR